MAKFTQKVLQQTGKHRDSAFTIHSDTYARCRSTGLQCFDTAESESMRPDLSGSHRVTPPTAWFTAKWPLFSWCLSACLCRVFLSRLWSDLDQTRTYVTCPGL